ncbi:dihydrofolate reductase [Chitinophaga sp. SYP-B3965]|uniref:dihydrofolate reductase family protein n=1 Tax=Chitinophaga sp. SYP-B3965 TaxID=2663120 RepID=UPI001299A144|nr:dihydrofolate reductase family protein [Chitinophaga sp. SYP-B3965]MRG45537.1 dihydrofolate reductase [Chitinophaga sp. SYP-B3965]
MSTIVVSAWVTLDGIFDANSMHEWFNPFDSLERQKYIQGSILGSDALLLGRITYEMLSSYWPNLKNNEMGVAAKLNSMPKYVVSSSLKKADWENSTIINGDLVAAITKLKEQEGGEIQIEGSATLVEALAKANLVDEFRFLVHPVIMGTGKRFFREEMQAKGLKLVKSEPVALGVMLLCYKRA